LTLRVIAGLPTAEIARGFLEVCPQGDACSHAPVRVTGGHRFVHVEGGVEAGGMPWLHSCGLTTAREVYCWGENSSGVVGEQPTNVYPDVRTIPVRVTAAPPFKLVRAGASSACGLTDNGIVHCWGEYRRLGIGPPS
jgi:alpha-tubulin suppressor-like RCC1 family protein